MVSSLDKNIIESIKGPLLRLNSRDFYPRYSDLLDAAVYTSTKVECDFDLTFFKSEYAIIYLLRDNLTSYCFSSHIGVLYQYEKMKVPLRIRDKSFSITRQRDWKSLNEY